MAQDNTNTIESRFNIIKFENSSLMWLNFPFSSFPYLMRLNARFINGVKRAQDVYTFS